MISRRLRLLSAILSSSVLCGTALAAEPPLPSSDPGLDESARPTAAAGRTQLVFLEAEIGPEYVALQALKASKCGSTNVQCGLVDSSRVKTEDLGLLAGVGIGLRLPQITVAAHFRHGNFSDWRLMTLGFDVGVTVPVARIEPRFTLGAGYASLAGIQSNFGPVDIDGLDARASAGLDFHVSEVFFIGASLNGDVLFLGRKGDGISRLLPTDPDRRSREWVYAIDGSATGLAGTLSAVLGVRL